MGETSEKVPIAEDFEQCLPPAYSTSATKTPVAVGRLLRFGAAALIAGAVLMLCGSIGAFYLWKASDKNGITGIRFSGGEKCYIKSQIKANLPEVETLNKESLMFDLEDEIMPVKFDEESLMWVAADQPLKDSSFLSTKILDLCGDLPIFWLHPTYPKDGERRKRDTQRAKRQFDMEEFEAAAEERNTVSRAENSTSKRATEEEAEATGSAATGSAYNPENPYHRNQEGEEGTMTFDPMLDHQGICCSECRRSYTHCQRICEPLGGHWPWPYNYRGCQVACRVILPCRWWVARILGIV
ncbi:leukocyte cell-derived chemotaxin 1 isoform X2 [Oncorhynchus mykiss]|uniref:leukocyte cell-derived chemotaxin 1 isoform X2 n=1 Tax=Oncorhynchus mykiss TaxID=8022 RepID=UPI001878BDBB|nr:leukocyte cell-derived chemotaxin 1 isoform X2 [Oncorhynchus mykiss]